MAYTLTYLTMWVIRWGMSGQKKKPGQYTITGSIFCNREPDFCDPVIIPGTMLLETFWKFNSEWKNGLTCQNWSTGSNFRAP